VVLRDPLGDEVLVQIVKPERLGVTNQFGEDTVLHGEGPEKLGTVVDPGSHEVAQGGILADHGESAVPRPHQLARRSDHSLEHGLEGQVFGDGDDGREQAVHVLLEPHEFLGPGDELFQEAIESAG
jgi:hypothetical protein